MTVPNACLVFLLAFSGVTGWLLLREPAEVTVTGTGDVASAQPDQREIGKTPAVALSDYHSPVRQALDSTEIPLLDLNDTTLEEAVDFLRLRSRELNSAAGLSFRIIRPATDEAPHVLDTDRSSTDPLINIYEENISFADALDLICNKTDHHWEINDHHVLILPN